MQSFFALHRCITEFGAGGLEHHARTFVPSDKRNCQLQLCTGEGRDGWHSLAFLHIITTQWVIRKCNLSKPVVGERFYFYLQHLTTEPNKWIDTGVNSRFVQKTDKASQLITHLQERISLGTKNGRTFNILSHDTKNFKRQSLLTSANLPDIISSEHMKSY